MKIPLFSFPPLCAPPPFSFDLSPTAEKLPGNLPVYRERYHFLKLCKSSMSNSRLFVWHLPSCQLLPLRRPTRHLIL